MLEKLALAFGVSGCEGEVRDIILSRISADSVNVDFMGNIIAFREGSGSKQQKKTILLAAHMDEVGFIVSRITGDGFLKFKTIGGIASEILPAKRVLVGTDKIPGVIGCTPKHLMKKGSDSKQSTDDLFIDVGLDKSSIEERIKPGDYACFDSGFVRFGDGLVKCKALDDRVGCAVLLQLMERQFFNDVYFAFTVQEEIGCRGSKVAAASIDCDYAFVVETTTCADLFSSDLDNALFSTVLGSGVAVSVFDGGSYADKQLSDYACKLAEENGIPVQRKRTTFGGNDAVSIQSSKEGVRLSVLSVPCRYIHSPSCVCSTSDIKACSALLDALLCNLR